MEVQRNGYTRKGSRDGPSRLATNQSRIRRPNQCTQLAGHTSLRTVRRGREALMSIRFVVLSLLFCCFIGTTGFGFGQHCFACETVNVSLNEDIAAPLPAHTCLGHADCWSGGLGCYRCDGRIVSIGASFIPDQYCHLWDDGRCIQASIRGPDGEHVSWDIECCPFVTLATCYD
jgi:hypothetical protein